MISSLEQLRTRRTGWLPLLARVSAGVLLFETVTGLAISFAPFHPAIEWGILVHTAVGGATVVLLAWYIAQHWLDYRSQALSDVVLLGYAAGSALAACGISGLVITAQALFGIRTSLAWRDLHLISTLAIVATAAAHGILAFLRGRKVRTTEGAGRLLGAAVAATAAGLALIAILTAAYSGTRYVNRFPKDYSFLYGKDRPFAPSLAQTSTGGALDARSLAGSETCGTSGCHTQIVREWLPSAHRYAAMDTIFQGIQTVMAKQNGPESTRYCAGCHDPISLFSGSKNIYADKLTNSQGRNEGISCLACHGIHKTDIRGNANYTLSPAPEYLWQWSTAGPARVARDFLIRSYPAEHNRLSKRMFKAPEYCAACHKQFIDQEVNRVGWVQLQNQYDNWAASHWNHKSDARKTVECRECHMPLVDSTDPAAGDPADYNRSPSDGKHRSHRFLAANNFMPALLRLDGWREHVRMTEEWLQGRREIPEIRGKWAEGPVVRLLLQVPGSISAGDKLPIRVILGSNKVGHDYPTGPLDIIQSWVNLAVTDDAGRVIFGSGRRNEKNFIEPGTFLFKAEPVDQYGNLIDRHNLWEMVGVRYRRSLFPGYSDTVEYSCDAPAGTRVLHVAAALQYRKIDQFLLNYVLGERPGLTAPVVDLARAAADVAVRERP